MTDKQKKKDDQKVVPQKPEASIAIPPKGETPVTSTSVPSSGTATPPTEIVKEIEKAVKDKIIPLPQEPEPGHPEEKENEQ